MADAYHAACHRPISHPHGRASAGRHAARNTEIIALGDDDNASVFAFWAASTGEYSKRRSEALRRFAMRGATLSAL